ncbi:arabinan endo-1,5-alpha-L-arabinosidase [Altererythrobacter atlanticus]|uniref:Intracellular endo-alpha-(1->5)-L-arabinanase n=1 Tax=Croceibacterium atlanticum TaxID=1267766 RepID=A0A0F7KUE3_9SPHN|nr:family 43 glycosylhydrolase [Croceibacterium atlanticum]AKH43239.1 Intracellular endo-alpha-(1->5)-L-arabinanase [Croceibacterium atlanticum]MBB5732055.1 arabinan endo-1,5-alpha-L-arabinosidase [Croceibacterium atlanticum]
MFATFIPAPLRRAFALCAAGIACTLAWPGPASAQLAGDVFIHDPSTIVESDGKWFTFGTRGGGLISEDGWTWEDGAIRPGGGVAPDVVRIGDRYYVAWAVGGGGMSGGHASEVKIMWTRSLDPASPDFEFHEVGTVASSDGVENHDAIDPAFLYHDGRLWLSYGTYFGSIRIIELDPATGMRKAGNEPVDIAIDMEATALMYRDGWYYLLGTHGTCCDGPNSTYNIRAGRSRNALGPYVDNMGIPLLRGGGKLVASAHDRMIGAGHFGLLDLGDGLQKFSLHYEADMDRSGRSVLAIEPLLWRDGWPVAGSNVRPGTYEIKSERSGNALQLKTDFVRIPFDARRSFMAGPDDPVAPLARQTLDDVRGTWPDGAIRVDLSAFMVRPNQLWTITPVPEAGGWFGAPFYKITIQGTERALAATPDREIEAVPAFSGEDSQLWRIDQLTDGTYRITPKTFAGEDLAMMAIGASTPTLAPFDPGSDEGRWRFRLP